MQIMCSLIGLTVCCFGEATLSWLVTGSPERDYLLSKGDMTLEKGLRSQHSKDVQLHTIHLDCPQAVNELPTISASM